jgi:3-deoxy-D-manno-octulosonic-acid transferase
LRFLITNLVYVLALACASPWLLWQAIRKGKYRSGGAEKLLGQVPLRSGHRPCLWIHAVSVGEVALADVIVKEISRRWPQLEVVISATSRTGYELAQARFRDRTVTYAPLDFSWAVKRALDRIRPDMLMLVELEMWPNLIWSAQQREIPVTIANGRLSAASHRGYRRLRPLVASLLRDVRLITAANRDYADRFVDLGANRQNVVAVGSIKFDGAETDRQNERTCELARIAGVGSDDIVFVAGSTQSPEEMMALATFQELAPRFPNLRLIIVPRHPERFDEVAAQLDSAGIRWQRRTRLASSPADERVLLVDTVGELSAWWGLADIAFVGGSMGSRGGQNMIEPAAYGAAVCFGPNTRNFREVTRLLKDRDAARVVGSADELTSLVRRLLEEPEMRREMGQRARSLVRENRGALTQTMELLGPVLAPLVERCQSDATIQIECSERSSWKGPHEAKTQNRHRVT